MLFPLARNKHAVWWFLQNDRCIWSLSEVEILLHMSNIYATTYSGLHVDIHCSHTIVSLPSACRRHIPRALDWHGSSTLHAQWRPMPGIPQSNFSSWMSAMLSHPESKSCRGTNCWTIESVYEVYFWSNLLSVNTRRRSEFGVLVASDRSACSHVVVHGLQRCLVEKPGAEHLLLRIHGWFPGVRDTLG